MSVETRIRRAIGSIVDGVEATPPPFESLAPAPARPRRQWRGPVFAGAAVLVLLLVVAVAPGAVLPARPGPSGAGGPPILPARFAGLSLLTAPVSKAPPGPAIALYTAGSLGTTAGSSQVIVVGADGRAYRRLDVAEREGVVAADGEWVNGDALLSPDGRAAAVAGADGIVTEVTLVDLTTGRKRGLPLGGRFLARLSGWSPDGTRLALLLTAIPDGQEVPYDSAAYDAALSRLRPAVLDVGTGALRQYDDLDTVDGAVAFSPDGATLAVGGRTAARLVDVATGRLTATVPLPDHTRLSTAATWSPDGRLLVAAGYIDGEPAVRFVDATGKDGPVPAPLDFGGRSTYPVAWRSATALVVATEDHDTLLVECDGAARRTLSRLPNGLLGLGRVGGVQLAAALVPSAVVRDTGDADRGPWPTWWRVTLSALLLGAAFIGVRRCLRRRT